MLSQVRIQNFRCLRDVTLPLGPFTVLVGPNASGKSAVLKALARVASEADTTHGATGPVRVSFDGREWGLGRQGPEFPKAQTLRLDPDRLRSTGPLKRSGRLDSDGSNAVSVLVSLGREGGRALAERFCALVPTFANVDFTLADAPELVFVDRWSGKSLSPSQVSDGSMLVLGYLLAAAQPDRPDLLLVDEPERGLHPWLLEQVVRLLRELTQPTEGQRPVQVVAATQSSELLEWLEPDEVRFLSREPATGDTLVRLAPTGDAAWPEVLASYDDSLGGLWLSGALGGVPGR